VPSKELACYTPRGSLEWVGWSPATEITNLKSQISDLSLAGGKSEHHRAADWLTARRGDPTTSATENRPADGLRAQVMGETVVGREALNVRDHRRGWRHSAARQTLRGARPNREASRGLPARNALVALRPPGRSLERAEQSAAQMNDRHLPEGKHRIRLTDPLLRRATPGFSLISNGDDSEQE